MANYKYYRTDIRVYSDMFDKLKELGYKGTHRQFNVVCKAKSRAEANRIAESYGLSKETFRRGYTHETGNDKTIEKADRFIFIIQLGGIQGDEYIPIKDIL